MLVALFILATMTETVKIVAAFGIPAVVIGSLFTRMWIERNDIIDHTGTSWSNH